MPMCGLFIHIYLPLSALSFISKALSSEVMHGMFYTIPKFCPHMLIITMCSVDFYLFAFSFDFGASAPVLPPVPLNKFWIMLHQPGPSDTPAQKPDPNPIQSSLSFTI